MSKRAIRLNGIQGRICPLPKEIVRRDLGVPLQMAERNIIREKELFEPGDGGVKEACPILNQVIRNCNLIDEVFDKLETFQNNPLSKTPRRSMVINNISLKQYRETLCY